MENKEINQKLMETELEEGPAQAAEKVNEEYRKLFGEGGLKLNRAQRRLLEGKRKKRL